MLNLSSGMSEKDRISFYSNNYCSTAIRNSDGKITLEFKTQNSNYSKLPIFLFSIFGLISLIKAFILLPLIENKTIGIICYLIPAFFYLALSIFAIIFTIKTGGKEFLKNHGAEHMVFSAYKTLKRIPTIEETKHFPRIINSCGVTLYSAFITSQLIGFVVYIHTKFIIPEIILFLFPIFFQTSFPFNFIGKIAQFFTTNKPEEYNIELAIAALTALTELERPATLEYAHYEKLYYNTNALI